MPPRPNAKRNGCDHADRECDQDGGRAVAHDRRRHDHAAVVEKDQIEDRNALARQRHRAEHGQIPEQDLEQERQVADNFHIAAGKARKQPVGAQPRKADDKAEDRREHDAENRHQQRIEQADDKDAGIGVLFAERDQRLADAEPRRIVQEAQAEPDVLRVEIGLGVEREFHAKPNDHGGRRELVERAANFGPVVDCDGFHKPSLGLTPDPKTACPGPSPAEG
jgi:hypothetical protein